MAGPGHHHYYYYWCSTYLGAALPTQRGDRHPASYPPYAENDWVGRDLSIGETRLHVLKPTSRCVLPTLEHGELPRAPHALRTPAAENRLQSPGSGAVPCAGLYLTVLVEGTIHTGDPVILQ